MVGVGETLFLQYLMFANSKCYLFVKTKTYFFIIIGCFESHLRTPTFTPEKQSDSSISRLFCGWSSERSSFDSVQALRGSTLPF